MPPASCSASSETGDQPEIAAQATVSPAVQAECAMLAKAYEQAKAQSAIDEPAIVEGCPGFERLRVNSDNFAEAGRFARAASASLPLDAAASGPVALRLYRRMISRGVPAIVAEDISRTATFADAVNAAAGG